MPNPRKTTLPAPRKRNLKLQDKKTIRDVRPSNGRQLYRNNSTDHPVTVQKIGVSNNLNHENKSSKSLDNLKKHKGNQPTPHYMKIKSRKTSNEVRLTGSKKEITVVTINANGRGALGLTPRYKIDLIKSYLLSSKPDTIFFQVRNSDMVGECIPCLVNSFFISANVLRIIQYFRIALHPPTLMRRLEKCLEESTNHFLMTMFPRRRMGINMKTRGQTLSMRRKMAQKPGVLQELHGIGKGNTQYYTYNN